MWEDFYNYIVYLYHSYPKIEVSIELLIIGFVVYSIMRFLQGTGGEKLFKGIAFLLVAIFAISLLTRVLNLDLKRIEWLFKYILGAVLIVAVIAFQPELRRGLMQLGGTRFSRNAVPEMGQVIEQVIDAAAVLSQTQIGALIAFEREVGLSDLLQTGTTLDARVTAELLNTVFWPGSPLHDMGLVIRRNRAAAAAVQFPLAEHGEYDRLLGSRHRAAIGLSKETDAVVVVVSEENGNISLAIDGKLTRFLTLEQLRLQLFDLMMPFAEKKAKKPKAKSSPETKISKIETDTNIAPTPKNTSEHLDSHPHKKS